jgi:ketosteroid isomerase-like protein
MRLTTLLLLLSLHFVGWSQPEVSRLIDELNRKADQAVVQKDIPFLQEVYGDDFVFTHGTGLVDSKKSWIEKNQFGTGKFISRDHDSTAVELHADIAIVTGRLLVVREGKDGVAKYGLRYVRVFVLRNKKWQMISHRTVKEWHY